MSVVVSIRVRREVAELAEEMVRCGLASSRNEAFNKLIMLGIEAARRMVERRRRVMEYVRLFEEQGGIVLEEGGDVAEELRRERG